jgi:perosamine synthetase
VAPRIAMFRPLVVEEAIAAVGDVLRSGWPGPGPLVERFEAEFATYVGAPHAVAVSSGSAALHLALRLLDLGPGDEVVTSPITFVGANQMILHTGATPVFADVHPDDGNLDMAAVEAAVGPRTRAVIATHLGGRPVDLDELYGLAARHGIAVVEDAAHACGSTYRGARIGSHCGTQAFSFQATKNLTTIDGGMLCVRDPADAARARRLRWMGIDQDTWSRNVDATYRWPYEVAEVGHKYAMNDLNAAIGLAQLPVLEDGNDRRRAIADRYRAGFAGVEGITVLAAPEDRSSATYLAAILAEQRDGLVDLLGQAGVATGVHYRRNDDHPIFGERRDLPGAERYWTRTLSLPVHLGLTDDQIDEVVEVARSTVPDVAARA